MRVLVTGVTGRIGANVAKRFLEEGEDVRGLVWPEDAYVDKLKGLDIELVYGDLRSYEDLCKAIAGVDAICALGAAFQRRDGRAYESDEYFQTNVVGMLRLLEAVVAEAPNISKIVFASSDAVYEKYIPGGIPDPIPETRPLEPRGWYALSKVLGEEMLWAYHRYHNLPVTALRFSYVAAVDELFTTHVPAFFSLGSWIEKLREAGPKLDDGSAEMLRTLESLWPGEDQLLIARMMDGRPYKKAIADVRDIVQGVVKATRNEGCIGQPLHISSIPFTWAEAVPYLSQRTGMSYVEARLPTIPTYYELDLSRARGLIGYEPQYTIFQMIEDALAFQRGEDVGIIPR